MRSIYHHLSNYYHHIECYQSHLSLAHKQLKLSKQPFQWLGQKEHPQQYDDDDYYFRAQFYFLNYHLIGFDNIIQHVNSAGTTSTPIPLYPPNPTSTPTATTTSNDYSPTTPKMNPPMNQPQAESIETKPKSFWSKLFSSKKNKKKSTKKEKNDEENDTIHTTTPIATDSTNTISDNKYGNSDYTNGSTTTNGNYISPPNRSQQHGAYSSLLSSSPSSASITTPITPLVGIENHSIPKMSLMNIKALQDFDLYCIDLLRMEYCE